MSPRPKKPRTCCPHRAPGSLVFKPAGTPLKEMEQVILELDELEALRLCDGEGLSQQDAGAQMAISRGTVQRLVSSGRRKIIEALLGGRALVVLADSSDEPGESLN
ncbi:MAG: hypothetical protein A2X84_13570 [Desulfuromonadaceae bacterium GWC2_58_13]|nr:MAG: hypothetical protein A2X84_13570 [Desulfuromonadaceae bacterium GWC2_58_13]